MLVTVETVGAGGGGGGGGGPVGPALSWLHASSTTDSKEPAVNRTDMHHPLNILARVYRESGDSARKHAPASAGAVALLDLMRLSLDHQTFS